MTIERLTTPLGRLIETGTASAELRKSVMPPRRNEVENEMRRSRRGKIGRELSPHSEET